jgi:hypothetical protein
MIVFYLKNEGMCMLAIDCTLSEITVTDNRAYYAGEMVNNNMAISAYAEVPKQSIYTESVGEDGFPIRTPKLFSELTQGTVEPTTEARIKAAEDAILAMMGV